MTTLFDRDWRVQIGQLVVRKPLHVQFEIERTTRPQPNAATIRIYNLTRDHQALIEGSTPETAVTVEAGFVGSTSQIFGGHVARARAGGRSGGGTIPTRTEADGTESVSIVECLDGGRSYAQARVAHSYQPGVSVLTVLRDCARALGLGEGNLREVERFAQLEGGQTTYPEGTVLAGQASRELTRILASYGLRWSVQHGAVQVIRRGAALQTQAVRLSSRTGLVGAPERGTRGRVKARALLTPELWPGRRVVLDADRVRGQMTIRSIKYEGDTHADTWFATLELVPEAA